MTSLRSGFRNRFIFDPLLSNALIISVLFSQNVWVVEFTSQIPDFFLRSWNRASLDVYFI